MSKSQQYALILLRVILGSMFFYAGYSKITDSSWSAAGYLSLAENFSGFYQWLASPGILPITNFVNEWGLLLLGVSLILGIFVRLSSFLGIVLMFLYYLVILKFPYPNAHAFIVDEHIIYICVLLFFIVAKAGRYGGLDGRFRNLPTWVS